MDTPIPCQKSPTPKSMLSATGSVVALAFLIRTITHELAPFGFKPLLLTTLHKLFTHVTSQITMVIEELNDLTTNQIYSAAEIYLGSKSLASTRRFKLSKDNHAKSYMLSLEKREEIIHTFEGTKFQWRYMTRETGSSNQLWAFIQNSQYVRR